MRIKVTQDHIDAAKYLTSQFSDFSYGRGECCPIALAMKTQGFPDAEVQVNLFTDGYRLHVPSSKMAEFINDFDKDLPVKPFSFEIPQK